MKTHTSEIEQEFFIIMDTIKTIRRLRSTTGITAEIPFIYITLPFTYKDIKKYERLQHYVQQLCKVVKVYFVTTDANKTIFR